MHVGNNWNMTMKHLTIKHDLKVYGAQVRKMNWIICADLGEKKFVGDCERIWNGTWYFHEELFMPSHIYFKMERISNTFFFNNLFDAYFWQRGGKNVVHIFVYQREVQVIYLSQDAKTFSSSSVSIQIWFPSVALVVFTRGKNGEGMNTMMTKQEVHVLIYVPVQKRRWRAGAAHLGRDHCLLDFFLWSLCLQCQGSQGWSPCIARHDHWCIHTNYDMFKPSESRPFRGQYITNPNNALS